MADQRSPSAPQDRELYTIPSCSSWFEWDGIHETERRELGEFFDGSSFSRNPRVYKEYRDFLIARYREDPSRRLTFTEARRSLVGDVAALHRVYLFLDRWGLVNFSAAERIREDEGGPGVFPVVAEDGPPASIKVVRFPIAAKGVLPPPPSGSKAGEEGVGSLRLPPLTSYSDVFGQRTPLAGRLCGDCGEVCVSGYHESKSGIVICTECFKSENLSTRNLSDVYEFNDQKIDGEKQMTNEWTDTETLFLLEAIVSKGPDWDLIANHVRRNRLDCIAKFIQLPFGELMLGSISGKYDQRNSVRQRTEESMQATPDIVQEFVKPDIQDIENSVEKGHAAEESKIEPPLKRRRSFADASDSLMEKVASLSSLAGPHVAAAAAGAAISALCDEHPYGKKVFMIDDNETNGTDFSFVLKEKPSSDLKGEDGETDEASTVAESATGENFGHLAFEIRAATATAFGAAAAHAKLLADQEDRQIEYLMASIIDMQLRKLQYKMKHFDELESIMEQHYTQIQQLKEDILREWIDVSQRALAAGIPKWKDHGFQKSILIKSTSIT